MKPILNVNQLRTSFFVNGKEIPAVDGVDFTINESEILGIVGESGSGKSVTSLSIMKLLKDTPGKIVGGSIHFDGRDLLALSEKEIRELRGNEIAMIFQEPMTSLNPVLTIGNQLREAIKKHLNYSRKKADQHAVSMLTQVGISRADEILQQYPHQLSGGMRQRVMIAMAMSCSPKLLIADEPTTALDVTIQAQILDVMKDMQEKHGTSILLITHDLGVIAETCDRVAVMYAGRIVEQGSVYDLFDDPKHPYTKGLLESIPRIGKRQERLHSIQGNVPMAEDWPSGCKFASRCPFVFDKCLKKEPPLLNVGEGRTSRCWLNENEGKEEPAYES
ncbi:ABC transporter ATP-binding protein [Bacillus vallismortis]|uniref:ABC transporter ATP-binding protein n=1 Tax=Bacillus vallismortis TaxID=72361 RepID=UPI000EF44878|nr:ABC transporter ATP-binding protein [Bacillus vallismortis]MBG9769331.1 peptide ABC transporter ATP-binding protein [Bacillus vallismortis]MCI3986543.1 ABC transporter ATP-binding protein [Bacillus vallismortis]MCI4138901.1 ABC transporter ATP-binding protein [Bacillus vallismortis]MCY7916967.1 ABC transporter ATP-binding protein [Bacillus vallismortis]MCY8425901.1 ABC transporter ATP-binding protein [Bacillus vallismortis]